MRAVAEAIPTQFILSEASQVRSRDRLYMIGAGDPGLLLNVTITGSPATSFAVPAVTPNNINGILLERQLLTGAQLRVMLTRQAEVNDAYIQYGGFNRLTVNLALAVNAGIIVRDAIAESPGIAGGIFDDPPPDQFAEPETATVPATVEPAPPPAVPSGLHGWAIVLSLGRWAFGLALRWGRRR